MDQSLPSLWLRLISFYLLGEIEAFPCVCTTLRNLKTSLGEFFFRKRWEPVNNHNPFEFQLGRYLGAPEN